MSGRQRWFASVRHRFWGRTLTLITALIGALALLVPMAVAQSAGPYHFKGTVWNPKPLPKTPAVGSHVLHQTTAVRPKGYKAVSRYRAVKPVWPTAGTNTVSLTRTTGVSGTPTSTSSASPATPVVPVTKPVKAGALPVWVAPAAGHKSAPGKAVGPSAVKVKVASHAQALRAGADGMLLAFTRADVKSGTGTGRVSVVIDYGSLAKAYGGGFGSRLRLFQVPACAMTTPQLKQCGTRTPIPFTNRAGADQLTATLALGSSADAASRVTSGTATKATAMSASADATTVEVTSGSSGSQGSYAATSLNPSGTWQTSGTGAFTYSYPIDVPSALGGNSPSVALSYDSQSEDGETSARNSQASWIGDGWNYQPGFVERTYRSCGSLLDSSGNKILKGSGDECWGGDNATVSFGSHSGQLVPDGVDSGVPGEIGQWRLQGDDGTLVQELSGAANGLQDGVYYRVLTTDGTAAYFGADHSPTAPGTSGAMQSGTPSDASTDSAWGVPVLHPRSGDPCYDSAKGKASQCAKHEGWRWNLDFVVSPSGFVQRYDYTTESNYYDLGGGQAASGDSGTLTSYVRGGKLDTISYGYTLGDEQAARKPAGQVAFTSQQRCQTTSTFTDCSAGNLNDTTAPHWPDVPWDLHCDSTDSTTLPSGATSVPTGVCVTGGPTFWSTTRVAGITTKVYVKDSSTDALVDVDSYQLGQVYSDAGGAVDPVTGTTVDPVDAGSLQAVMWLQSIQHTGKDTYGNGNSDIKLNQVSFTGTEIDNRVNDTSPSAPPLYRPRISSIQTETGESVAVDYNLNPCANKTLSISAADANTNSCYPVYWTVPGASKPIADWFNKTTVHTVIASDLTIASQYKPDSQNIPAGSEAQVSTYGYTGAAWHRDDSVQTDDQYRTWDQFRGFRTVTVQTGKAPEPVTQKTTTYLQGMDGDYKSDGTRRSVTVDAKVGGSTVQSVTDADQLAGTALESDTYTAAGGTINAETVNGPFTYTTTAHTGQTPWTDWTQEDNPGQTKPNLSTLPDLNAYRIKTAQSHGYALLVGGTWRHTRTDTAYDSQGRVSTVDAHGDVSVPAQEKCATTAYASPPAGNTMALSYPDQVTSVSGPCGTAASAATLLADKKIYYDGDGTLTSLGTFGQLDQSGSTAVGQASAVRTATDYTGSTENWQTSSAMKYDGAGRITDTVDATAQNTHTAFSPAWSSVGGNTNPTGITTTNSQSWKVTSTLDPLRGLPTENVDANSRKTDITYDALGRRTAVWLPGRDKASSQSADETFTYSINPGAVAAPGDTVTTPGAPSAVTTKTLREDGTYATSIAIYDGMLQPRQTQATADGDSNSGRIISDTFYDSHGWQTASFAPYSEPDNFPSTTLYAANENQIPSETTSAYDGEGRPVTSTLWHQAVQQWHTTAGYPGADETDTVAPAGGRSTATYTNALGQTTRSVVKNTGSTVKLTQGQVIPSGTSLTSASVRLAMQADGNLVLSSLATGKSLWSSGTSGNPGAFATLRSDGNFVVYNAGATTALWSSGTTTGTVLQIQNDANMVLYDSAGAVAWKSDTWNLAGEADATTAYTYTPAGQVDTIKDSAGNTWSYHYNLLGQKTSQTDPDTGTTSYDKYDVVGNLLQTTDPRGQVLSYAYDWDNRPTAQYNSAWSATPDPSKELASWAYDTLAKGYSTSATRYVGGASGSAYTQAVTGYNTAYQPTGTTQTVPATDGFATAGQSTAPSSGTVTYTSTAAYTPAVGLLSTVHYQADGNLPAEDVDYGYTQQGNLDSFGGFLNASDTPAYLDTTVHDPFGRILRTNYGLTGKELATFAQYDATTGRVTQTSSMLQTSTTALDVANYRYNQAGELTAIDDLQNNTTHDTQCFAYDSFQRLTAAWTDTAGITGSGTAPVGSVGGCTTGSVQTTTTAPVTTTTVGGPAPYWQTYTYDLLGDRTGMVNHDTTGTAANNTTQAIAYTGTDGTAAATLPNQAGTTTTTNATGSSTLTPAYTDSSGKNAGNTTSRTATTTGQIVSGIKTTTGTALCLADPGSSTTDGTQMILWNCGSGGQTWTIGTDGTVRVLGKCLDTNGSGTANSTIAVINTCSGAAGQQWKTTSGGTLVHVASGRCLADPSSNQTPNGAKQIIYDCGHSGQVYAATTTGTSVLAGTHQTLTYDTEGRTATVTTPDGTHTDTSKYLYDAGGNLLEQTSSVDGTDKTRVLYLFGGTEQITLNVSAKTWTGLRYYHGPDGTTITRSSSGTVTYQVANAQGTASTAIDASTMAVSRRSYDPYGNSRGPKPTSWVAADENRGFLGQPADTTTGLDLLGARNYDPAQGRFLTADTLFEAGDPNQMGGYTYAGDNPASGSDPTGTMLADMNGGGSGGSPDPSPSPGASTDTSSGSASPSPSTTPTPSMGSEPASTQTPSPSFGEVPCQPADFGTNRCENYGNGKVMIAIVAVGTSVTAAGAIYLCLQTGIVDCASGVVLGSADAEAGGSLLLGSRIIGTLGLGAARATEEYADDLAAEAGAAAKADQDAAAARAAAAKDHDPQDLAKRANAAVSEPDKPSSATSNGGTKSPSRCSFSPDTPVLMDNGKTKPIGKIKTGDKVEAANPKTGKHQGARAVQHVWINHDHDLLDLTIRTEDGHTATLHTTAKHPFWDDTTHTWVAAGKLHDGDALNTATNGHAYVVTTQLTPGTANRWNLTVEHLHTYYVVAGATPILVHNTGGEECVITLKYKNGWSADQINAADAKVAALNAADKLVVSDAAAARGSTSAADLWRNAGNATEEGKDIDHVIDLQLGGMDDVSNLSPLDFSVNRSLGPQIDRQIRRLGLQIGDEVDSVRIIPRQ
ncbi:ricin-type beta-trefoil lectin domain protein [Streptomyces turgidiscabies]|uniref:RHS repeat-associated core domain protein n=1 Tax=Streptomyces turgidiscabies (strain Car8) TaxID=698760 RepID=L7F5V1_STRT8|nr:MULTISPECIES: ricin-type beta-trefoil lectin domain protein [Streptomyces]ELP66504.1 RHS repeat-associated core domain protein [Streptomyces turgidiscabies Car8]MDX3492680.1 ricin-type beta-trefoil lectin domain protein [Streptomyces turgidiscabies]GAQ69025.1 endo-1,4-beta-xylanase A precursor [Streptomyces turgidiscabies]